jgi:hypothetical protein
VKKAFGLFTNTRLWYFDVAEPLPPQRFYRAWQTSGPSAIPTERKESSTKSNLILQTRRRHSPTSLPALRTISTPASTSMPTRLRRRLGRAPSVWLALLALALTLPIREAGAQPVTLPATAVTSRSATLNCTIYQGWGWLVCFDWGTSTSYGDYTPLINVGTGTNVMPFSAPVVGLTPNTTYHFRGHAQHGAEFWAYGSDQSFTTLPDTVPFGFTINGGAITITGYGGAGGAVSIPSTINGLPVTSIGTRAFYQCTVLTSVTIPNSVTNIGDYAFSLFTGLASITIPNSVTSVGSWAFDACTSVTSATIPNSVTELGIYAFESCTNLNNVTIGYGITRIRNGAFQDCRSLFSVTIPNSVTSIGNYVFYLCTNLSSVMIPDNVVSLGDSAFALCSSLTNLTLPNSLTRLGDRAFWDCTRLTALHFGGNAPGLGGSSVFTGDTSATAYYLPGTTGWGATFGGLPTASWFLPNPLILTSGSGFGVQSNAFGFIISWATDTSVVVEACTNPANPNWAPLKTNALTGGWCYFSDPQWANYPGRFYRLRWH